MLALEIDRTRFAREVEQLHGNRAMDVACALAVACAVVDRGELVAAARRAGIDYFFRTMFGTTLFEQMGGEWALRRIVSRFVDRMFDDVMIGFMFRTAKRERIKEMEYEFAARHLGAPVHYSGRPLSEAHAPHLVNAGQFDRRTKLLADTLDEMGVPSPVREHWIRHTLALRNQILSKSGNDCAPPAPEDVALEPGKGARS